MLNNILADHVYLASGSTDMRKSIDGLAITVKEKFKLDPFSNCPFVFCKKILDKI
ncbi:MAG: transposase [Tissierellia bacterium]|nr:transposase [Tissierellia bacterium]